MYQIINTINLILKNEKIEKILKFIENILIYASFTFPFIVLFMTGKDYTIFGSLAWAGLILIMTIRPLADIFIEVYLFRRIVAMRRAIGIAVGMAVIAHGIGFFHVDSSRFIISELFSMTNFLFYGIIASIFSFLLLITSNTFSVKLLGKNWKRLQLGVYGMFYLACLHIAFIQFPRIDYGTLLVGGGIFLFRIYAWRKKGKSQEKNNTDNGGEEYQCNACGYIYNENIGDPDGGILPGTRFEDIPESWKCPVCGVGKNQFTKIIRKGVTSEKIQNGISYLGAYERSTSIEEGDFRSIFEKAVTGKEEISAMGTKKNWRNLFEDIFFLPGQLATRVYDEHEISVNLDTVIGPKSAHPITLKLPFYISHMSFGSLSREAKIALAKGSKSVGTMICSGEGGLLEEEYENAGVYVFEYSTGRFGATEENMKKADAIEIKIGQAAKAGLGGHLMGAKVTEEIAKVRGVEPWKDVISPANHTDIKTKEDLKERVTYLRNLSGGKPIGIKIVASHIEADLEVAIFCNPDFITIDCRGGATGAAPTHVKDNVCIPAPYAIYRARKFLDTQGVGRDISLCITGGFRTSADIAKAIAMGADAVAISTVAMIGIGCQQYRVCHKGTCPVGIATQNPDLRKRFDMYKSAEMLVRLFNVYKKELEDFVRILGKEDIHALDENDLVTISSEISEYTNVGHA